MYVQQAPVPVQASLVSPEILASKIIQLNAGGIAFNTVKIINNVSTPFSVGYINLLGFLVFVPVTTVMARLGAKAVYRIDKKLLSKIFGTFLIIVSIRSFIEYLNIS